MPSVIALTRLPPELGHPRFRPKSVPLDPVLAREGDDYVIDRHGAERRAFRREDRRSPARPYTVFVSDPLKLAIERIAFYIRDDHALATLAETLNERLSNAGDEAIVGDARTQEQ